MPLLQRLHIFSPPRNHASAEIFTATILIQRKYALAAFFILRFRCVAANLVLQTVFLLLLPLKGAAT
jgi:hypothetical protein